MISILIPVLGRPQNVEPVVSSIADGTSGEYEIHFLCSPEDEAETQACMDSGAHHVTIVPWACGPSDYARKMNYGFAHSAGEWIFLGADDLSFEAGWDSKALAVSEGNGVVGTNDMASRHVMSGQSSTHPLVRRSYVEEYGGSADGPGVLIHEGYDHNFSERELIGLAILRGEWIFCRESIVRHVHPVWGTAEWDDTYRKAMAHFQEDQRLFVRRSALWAHSNVLPGEG